MAPPGFICLTVTRSSRYVSDWYSVGRASCLAYANKKKDTWIWPFQNEPKYTLSSNEFRISNLFILGDGLRFLLDRLGRASRIAHERWIIASFKPVRNNYIFVKHRANAIHNNTKRLNQKKLGGDQGPSTPPCVLWFIIPYLGRLT